MTEWVLILEMDGMLVSCKLIWQAVSIKAQSDDSYLRSGVSCAAHGVDGGTKKGKPRSVFCGSTKSDAYETVPCI